MYISLAGEWSISLEGDAGHQEGKIQLPGILQAQGYGNPITKETPWISALHDTFWHEQEEYKYAQEDGVNVPFLSQPPRHFMGIAVYERSFAVAEDCEQDWYFHVELCRWKSRVWIDGVCMGEDCSLVTPHEIKLGKLSAGEHSIKVIIDNSMIYNYRPDAHGVSDALGVTWNGMVGEMALYTEDVVSERKAEKKSYAAARPRTVEVKNGCFVIDGNPIYFRATHFGGEYPLTGYPSTDADWWRKMMRVIKEWGLNGIRFHSYCPPEVAFAVADEEDIYLLVECGMWNHFEDSPEGELMKQVLREETRRILENFGHHPSFVFFSPSNEPSGAWYAPLKRWVKETRAYDAELGYGGRRIYTAQSGWPFDVPPAEVKAEESDFIYFHRSGFGPFMGGTIRNPKGWRGGDYSVSVEGAQLPIVCHELGQFCAYPNYDIIEKYTGYLQPSNYKVFRENARANGILPYAEEFVKCSGENQLRMYKEDLEANFRTPELQGFEMLDLHDYLGQGTALVGILDAFWENKGYGNPEEFKQYCSDTVLLTRCSSYVWKSTDRAVIPVEVCHYGKADMVNARICWKLRQGEEIIVSGELTVDKIVRGGNTKAGELSLNFEKVTVSSELLLELSLDCGEVHSYNNWKLHVFAKTEAASTNGFVYTRDWAEAKEALKQGKNTVFVPFLSELNYECPALTGRTVGWNSQMGPTWARTMGVVVQDQHPIFKDFPTGHCGGWQWEDILRHGRGFHMEGLEQVKPLVQPIDDWNRNLLQGLIFEAKVLGGNLLVAAIDWNGEFEQRPEAYSLKQSVLRYAASDAFAPEVEADVDAIERKLFPMLRMGELTEAINIDCNGEVRNGDGIVTADPNDSMRMRGGDFPVKITISLKKAVKMRGFVYVPEQRDRSHAGFAKEFVLEVRNAEGDWEQIIEGTFQNTCHSQNILFDCPIIGETVRLTVKSAYGCQDKYVWHETREGWKYSFFPKMAVLQIAGIHLICDEDATRSDHYGSGKDMKSRTKEIEL